MRKLNPLTENGSVIYLPELQFIVRTWITNKISGNASCT